MTSAEAGGEWSLELKTWTARDENLAYTMYMRFELTNEAPLSYDPTDSSNPDTRIWAGMFFRTEDDADSGSDGDGVSMGYNPILGYAEYSYDVNSATYFDDPT